MNCEKKLIKSNNISKFNQLKTKTMGYLDILSSYVSLRASIDNSDNGKMKLGCVAYNPKLNHQCVLCVWA